MSIVRILRNLGYIVKYSFISIFLQHLSFHGLNERDVFCCESQYNKLYNDRIVKFSNFLINLHTIRLLEFQLQQEKDVSVSKHTAYGTLSANYMGHKYSNIMGRGVYNITALSLRVLPLYVINILFLPCICFVLMKMRLLGPGFQVTRQSCTL